jgi:hypothetical protein
MSATFAWVGPFLAEQRADYDSLFVDVCTITRAGEGKGEFNETTGQYDKPDRITIYTGRCRIQVNSVSTTGTDTNAGDRVGLVQAAEWQGPIVDTENVSVNDVIHMDSCANDASLVGREFTVVARHEKTHATSRRLPVKEITG